MNGSQSQTINLEVVHVFLLVKSSNSIKFTVNVLVSREARPIRPILGRR